MEMKRLIVDLPSLSWSSLFAGKDEEFGKTATAPNGRVVHVNSYRHAYENAVNALVSVWLKEGIQPKDTILVAEKGNTTKMRKEFLPTYKEKRYDGRPSEYFDEYNKFVDLITETVRSLGGSAVTRWDMEADDVIAFLVQSLSGKKVIMSNDNDMAVLISDDVSMWKQGELMTDNPYGPFKPEYIRVYKALVGDTSDKIPGAKGFGPKAFLNLSAMFGDEGIEEVERKIRRKTLDELEENVADLKSIQNILNSESDVYASYACAKLYPEFVENIQRPLQWSPGFLKQTKDIEDERLKPFGGKITAIHKGNVDKAFQLFKKFVSQGRHVALDIETSMPQESIDWLMEVRGDKKGNLGVDVIGSILNGMSLTFGFNQRHTYYFTVGHLESDGIENIEPLELLEFLKQIPEGMPIVVHNAGFEQPVLYNTWGKEWKDNGWHGFLPNVHDTIVLANYVDENSPVGLKDLSKRYFSYDQVDYETVTQGRKMDELTVAEVLSYGADDTIMTSALYDYFKIICEIEESWEAYVKYEVKAAYVTALAFVQGTTMDLPKLANLRKEDTERREELQKTIDNFLIDLGWEGTVCPVFKEEDLDDYKKLKEIFEFMTGVPLVTRIRTASKIIKLVEAGVEVPSEFQGSRDDFDFICQGFVTFSLGRNIDAINKSIASKFDGRPKFDISSANQVSKLLYYVLDLPVKVVNSLTPLQREKKPELASAVWKFNKIERGSTDTPPLTEVERELIKEKASTDDTAIKFILNEKNLEPKTREFLEAFVEIKEIGTRFSLFYNNYEKLSHWKTGKIHSSVRLTSTVTRRATSSKPNLQQISKRGEGRKIREVFVPHRKDGFMISIDYSAQELRCQADLSQDSNFLACYIGESKKDVHSMTAAAAMEMIWDENRLSKLKEEYGIEDSYELFMALRKSSDAKLANEVSDLRDTEGKGVNFLSSYGGTAYGLSHALLCPLPYAETLLQAKFDTFKGYEVWKKEEEKAAERNGFVQLKVGGRRHLQKAMQSENSWERDRAARQASNFHIQGSCAAQTKLAMSNLWDSGLLFNHDVVFFAPVHDELVISSSKEDAYVAVKTMHECMSVPFWDTVPVVAEASIGPNFSQQHEIGEEVTQEAFDVQVQKVIEERGY